ncbi:hypothetical protein Tco_1415829 [Tanacetum coccineum]
MDTVKHTHVVVSVLWKSLSSVLINHEVRLRFEVRVAALLADIVAADERSRAAIVGTGGGIVVDWLLDSVALNKGAGSYGTQAESVRALAYLIADCNVAEAVLKRPKAVPIFLRIMLVAIMDIVTSECDNVDKVSLKPMLSRKAAMRDIAAALEVVEEGGMYLDEPRGNGLGINFVGLTRSNGSMELEKPHDDLDSQHVAVPFAAWALANWAMALNVNRSHIQELDHNGHAINTLDIVKIPRV